MFEFTGYEDFFDILQFVYDINWLIFFQRFCSNYHFGWIFTLKFITILYHQIQWHLFVGCLFYGDLQNLKMLEIHYFFVTYYS